jgi:8-oxo-dGTP pyrophosphatase MutT (NUDIX family)
MRRTVSAFIVQVRSGRPRLLVHDFVENGSAFRRVPGGHIEVGEEPEQALYREIKEESGIDSAIIVRKLGTAIYFNEFLGEDVERQDFFVRIGTTPDQWSHRVIGAGKDSELVFRYSWIAAANLTSIDVKLVTHLNEVHLPELFA